MSGMITATRCEVRVRRLRATPSGRYPSARMASSTRSRVDTATGRFPDRTWDTVVLLTCARLATSAMVTRVLDANRFTTAKRVVAMLSGVNNRPTRGGPLVVRLTNPIPWYDARPFEQIGLLELHRGGCNGDGAGGTGNDA